MIEYEIDLAGCQCSVVEWNPSGSILVFALHGWLDNLATFESLVRFMPDIRVVAFDFPGHGHSEHIVAGSAYHFIDGLYFVDDLARYFNVDRFHLIGHSMGGAVASLYAATQPERIKSIVVIESIGPLTAKPEEAVQLLHNAVTQRAELADKIKPVYRTFEQALLARATVSKIAGKLIEPIVERGLTKLAQGYTWRADSRLRVPSASRLSEDQLKSILVHLTCPILSIEGNSGLLVDNAAVQARKALIKNLQSVHLEGGHHVHLEQPEKCAELVVSFLKATDTE